MHIFEIVEIENIDTQLVGAERRMSFKYRIIYIILHYKTDKDTRKCIDSIYDLDGYKDDAIVVVDNSYNISNTGRRLNKEYDNYSNFFYVPNYDNCSFSHGNNIGYQYAKSIGGGQFIVVTNSDTYFLQKDFYLRMLKTWKKEQFHLCGPNIIDPHYNIGTSPIAFNCLSEEEALQDILHYQNKIDTLSVDDNSTQTVISSDIKKLLRGIKSILCEIAKYIRVKTINPYPVLNGACLIFSWLYLEENESIFFPETELYGEEQLLTYNCKQNNYKVSYSPYLRVMHVGGMSTSADLADLKERKIKTYTRIIKAREIYIEYINKDKYI